MESTSFPVVLAQEGKSASAPTSVATAFMIPPTGIFFIFWLTLTTGRGQRSPFKSRRLAEKFVKRDKPSELFIR